MNDSVPISVRIQKLVAWRGVERLLFFSLALLVILVSILCIQFLPSRYQLNEGDVCVYDIRSPMKITFVSAVKTQEAKDQAAAAVPDLCTFDVDLGRKQLQKANDFFQRISEIRKSPDPLPSKRDAVKAMAGASLSDSVVDQSLSIDDVDWQAVVSESSRIINVVMQRQIGHKDLAEVVATIPSTVNGQLSVDQNHMVSEFAQNFVQPNFLLDSEGTMQAKQEARDAVAPVRYTLEKGETILREGDVVRPLQLEELEAAGLRNPTIDWRYVISIGFIVAVIVAVLSLYLYFYRPTIVGNGRRLLLFAVVIVVAVFLAKLIIPGRELYGYVFPAAAVAMLVATLLDTELAVVSAIVTAIFMGLISNSSLEMVTMVLVGGLVGTLGARRVERLNAFFVTGIEVALANFIILVGFQLSNGDIDLNRAGTLLFVSIGNGLLCSMVTLALFSGFGRLFGITTSLGLLELAHPTQPLFRRLLMEAPGTYHHSVLVANLSERAAQSIGADALLARVGGYYHDIGKIVNPYFFIENQLDGQNIHDKLDARTSVQNIAAHVSDGSDLARRFGLPSKVIDIIEQHHGTSLVRYFYAQACQESDERVSPGDFCYPGPRPQTREAAIIMLADSVEATVRASRDYSVEHIELLVYKAVADRLAEGQLDECDLTIRDLDMVKKAFVLVLQGIFHPRITYPEMLPLPSGGNGGSKGGGRRKKGWSLRERGRSSVG